MLASGGQVDGSPGHNPHYCYGGLWRNHHAPVSGRGKVPAPRAAPSGPAPAAGTAAATTDEAANSVARAPVDVDNKLGLLALLQHEAVDCEQSEAE